MVEVEVFRVDVASKKVYRITDQVAEEKPLYIFVNKNHYATIFCSPRNLKELAAGHLLSEGIVKSVGEIEAIDLKDEGSCNVKLKPNVNLERRLKLVKPLSRVILSACGSSSPYQFSPRISKIKSDLTLRAETILDCVKSLNSKAETYRRTGGVHAAAIFRSDGDILSFAEDVGRHNAVDKVIGMAALDKIGFGQCFLALTGRMTGDIVLKAARVGLPVVVSLAAAIDSGIKIAKRTDLTLIGFARGRRMNAYNFPERILA